MMTGLEPRGFTWVIAGRLAVSERIGGYGFQHRRVRREEEISWLQNQGVNALLSLLDGNQNLASYEAAGITLGHQPLTDLDPYYYVILILTFLCFSAFPGFVLSATSGRNASRGRNTGFQCLHRL